MTTKLPRWTMKEMKDDLENQCEKTSKDRENYQTHLKERAVEESKRKKPKKYKKEVSNESTR